MDRELDNANPTILNVSQLPSRRRDQGGALTRGPCNRYDDILSDAWSGLDGLSASSDEDEEDCRGFTSEPIDEQEIYGTRCLFLCPRMHFTHASEDGHSRAAVSY